MLIFGQIIAARIRDQNQEGRVSAQPGLLAATEILLRTTSLKSQRYDNALALIANPESHHDEEV